MDIGSNIRALRKRKGITLIQLCLQTGLSQGFLSQVETNKTSPSIATLENIAQALEVPLAYLLLKQEERMTVVRSHERQITTSGSDHLQVEHLGSNRHVKMLLVHVPPGASTGEEVHAHEGEEVHLVLQGRIYARQGEDEAELNPGDTFSWNACAPHLVRNISEETAFVLIAVYKETGV